MTDTQQRLDWHDNAIRTPAHTADPEPATAAGMAAAERSTERAAVLAAINAWPMTHDELDFVFAAWPARNAAKRCSDLHTAAHGALVQPTGETRPTRHGRQATVWQVTSEGAALAAPWRGVHPRELVANARARFEAGLDAQKRWECPWDHQAYRTPAGLIQHLNKKHGHTREPS